jgi:hypothetical protein
MLDCSDDVYIDSTLLYSTDEVNYSDMFIYFQAVRDGTSVISGSASKHVCRHSCARAYTLLIYVAPASHDECHTGPSVTVLIMYMMHRFCSTNAKDIGVMYLVSAR